MIDRREQMKKPVIIGIGELLWDMLPTGKRAGGAPINFVYNATQLGAEGYAISAVGKDALGEEILKELQKSGIKGIIDRNAYPTGVVEVSLKNGIPSYTIVEGTAWDHINILPEAIEIMKKADAVCFGTLALRHEHSKQTIKKLLHYAPQTAFKLFDINLRGTYYSADLIDELLRLSNIFKINDDEIKIVCKLFNLGTDDETTCRILVEKYNLKYLIFTAGDKFSIVYSQNEKSYLKTPVINVCDTVGAGDSFSAAFVWSLLQGESLTHAHQNAVKTSAFICTRAGAWPKYERGEKS